MTSDIQRRLEASADCLKEILEAEIDRDEANDLDAKHRHRKRAAERFMELIGQLDAQGIISEYYEIEAEKGGKESRLRHQSESAARFLLDAGGAQGAFRDGPLARGMNGLSAYVMDRLQDLPPEPLFEQKVFGSKNRPKNTSARGAVQQLARIVYYLKGREGLNLPDVFSRLVPDRDWDSFRKTNLKYITPQQRKQAHNAGSNVRRGGALSELEKELANRCTHFLDNEDELNGLVRMAYRQRKSKK